MRARIDVNLVLTTGFTLVIGMCGVALATLAHVPLPWMLGPLFATAAVNLSGLHPFGLRIGMPRITNRIFIPVIAISISSGVTPSFLISLLSWWPSLVAMIPFVVVLQMANYMTFRLIARYDRATAFFSASPGGVAESVLLGEGNGGNPGKIVLQHSSRVTLAIIVLPFLLTAILHSSYDRSGALATGGGAPFSLWQAALLTAAAALGAAVALRFRLPASPMIGPLVLGSILFGTGITTMTVPPSLLHLAQLAIGTMLGCRFREENRRDLLGSMPSAVAAFAVSAAIAATCALAISATGIAPASLLFLSFAPGGLSEMSLVAISLGADPVFVAAHHLARIIATVFLSPWIFSLMDRKKSREP
ncbi:AbrB family transcriptional regulator [Sinisalibacter aestuarii]|uniref:Monooxygenase n=1 Tax=Sinisalibacter aestuarii TaxID=2949426 RepID=A0ABQ5LYS4_9RHOB|nr:AbrB family transcriptional regulator [Sinisalibacter aestuarii]GKY90120.1 monooxygenase [Sinisalibacter aestuarii]